ncbi:hypothetical protein [Nocardioides sp. 503]|uniref:hypothetical protein n=1 Tax=Nocardioides sp. 503 TaxID=2508326 RepID=UPI001431A455|nr:hypothetical protein [Nocardioides sp. 503]
MLSTTAVAPTTSASAAASAPAAAQRPAYRCGMDVFGHTASGRIKFRRVENARVEVSKTSRGTVDWRPISWALVSLNRWPGTETTNQLVAATDGKVRLVETEWHTGSALDVRVSKIVGRGYPSRRVSVTDGHIYWVAADGSLHRKTWNGARFVRPMKLPVSLSTATAMTALETDFGRLVYYTDRAGALHVVADDGPNSTDTVLRSSGYGKITGLRVGSCISRDYSGQRYDLGLLSVNRKRGVARFQRALRAAAAEPGRVTKAVRVRPSDWTWRRLG